MGELLGTMGNAGGTWLTGKGAAGFGIQRREAGEPHPEQEQLRRYAEAFFGLARLFQELPCQRERISDEELEAVFLEVRDQLCHGCSRENTCWTEDYLQSCRLLYEILGELDGGRELSRPLAVKLRNFCLRPGELLEALQKSYENARINLLWTNRLLEQRTAAGEQIYQTAMLLQRTAEGFSEAPDREEKLRKKLKKELRYLGVELNGIRVFLCEEGRPEIYLNLRMGKKGCVSVKAVAGVLTGCCREKMRPAWNCRAAVGREPGSFHFVRDTRYQVFCGISRITKAGELVSGDNFAFLQKDTGKVVMSLADGMGSGAGACRESEKVIELLEQFLEAGFPQETAVRMINSCMLLQNRSQMFSTIDLCMIDLYCGDCDMIKSGAVSTFIRCGNEVEVIGSGAFPAGVLQQSDYRGIHRRLKSGSTVIMMTDGVLDALPETGREQLMVELIGKCASENAREYARRLMERVYLMQKLQARDDMTILVGSLWKK